MTRRVRVFFHGLFMDEDVLRTNGFDPHDPQIASLPGFKLRVGWRVESA
jgi:hypothetical protein